jgi:excisionase family DNA binding protein
MNTALDFQKSAVLPETDRQTALEASRAIARLAGRGTVRVEAVPDSDKEPPQAFVLPAPAVQLLAALLVNLGAGQPVTVVPEHAEFTTQQAADYLNVSRPHVVKLIERGDLPHRMVGTHRRVLFADLRAYQDRLRTTRRTALDALAAEAQATGEYE